MKTSSLSLLLSATLLLMGMTESSWGQQKHRDLPKQMGGIKGEKAPAWKDVTYWEQLPEGKESLDIADFKGKILYLYYFQSW